MTQTTEPRNRLVTDTLTGAPSKSLEADVNASIILSQDTATPAGTPYLLPASAAYGRVPAPLYVSHETSARDIELIMAEFYRSQNE